MGQIFANML